MVAAGHGKIDMIPLTKFTVNVNNPDKNQLANDLTSWFHDVGLDVYNTKWPLTPFP